MALSSKLFTEDSPGKPVLKRCSEDHSGHLLRGMSTNAAIKDAISRVQSALKQLGFSVSDPPGVYGAGTEAAVLKFKGPPRNILGPGQKKPDAIVGIQTIHQLDKEIQGGTKPTPLPEFGSDQWRFTFFANKGITGKGLYRLFIASTTLSDSQEFIIEEQIEHSTLLGGYLGETKGTFQTPIKMFAKNFNASFASVQVFKANSQLTGFMRINVIDGKTNFTVVPKFAPFRDERAVTGALESGTVLMQGQIVKSR